MYTPTQNYGLAMPSYGDEADIGVINDMVTAKVDELLFQNRTISAPPFENTEAYTEGDLVVYENVLYRFTSNKAAGAWDSSKVVQTSLAAEIENAGSGASALADLDDVEITSPTDGQALLYDDSDDKWKNQTLPDASVTKTATGKPIELTDAASAPLVKCVTQITGSQDLHGQDKPWVGGAGKNKLPTTANSDTVAGITYTVQSDGSITYSGTASGSTGYAISRVPLSASLGTIILSGIANTDNIVWSNFYLYDSNDNLLGNLSPSGKNDHSYDLSSYTDLSYGMLSVKRRENIQCSGTIYPMIRLGGTSSTWEPYSNICPITAYTEGEIEVRGKNIFGTSVSSGYTITSLGVIESDPTRSATLEYTSIQGNIDYVLSYVGNMNNGVFFYDENKDFISFLAWGSTPRTFKSPSNAAYVRFSFNSATVPVNMMVEKGSVASTYSHYTSTTHTTTYPSAIYRGSEDVVNGSVESEYVFADFTNADWSPSSPENHVFRCVLTSIVSDSIDISALTSLCNKYAAMSWADISSSDNGKYSYAVPSNRLVIVDHRFSTTADFIASLSDMQLVLKLATPTTSPVTPTNLPIKSLSGYNHIESSTGDMEVEYITETYQPLVDLIQSSSHVYSTAEQVVGKWVDGKDVYEKTVVSELALTVSWQNYVSSSDMDTIISVETRCTRDGEDSVSAFSYNAIAGWLNRNGYINVACQTEADWKILSMTIRYTKTTATRSISKGATDSLRAEISGFKSEGEEILKDGEEAIKIDESESIETKKEADETEENADEVQSETVTE